MLTLYYTSYLSLINYNSSLDSAILFLRLCFVLYLSNGVRLSSSSFISAHGHDVCTLAQSAASPSTLLVRALPSLLAGVLQNEKKQAVIQAGALLRKTQRAAATPHVSILLWVQTSPYAHVSLMDSCQSGEKLRISCAKHAALL
jgi:hypothetical protein